MLDTAPASQSPAATHLPILGIVDLKERLDGVPFIDLQPADAPNEWALTTDCGSASRLMEHRGFEIIRHIDYDDEAPYTIPFRVTTEARTIKRVDNGRYNTLRGGQIVTLPYMGKGWEGDWRIVDVKVTPDVVTLKVIQKGQQRNINDVNCGFVVLRTPVLSNTRPTRDFTPKWEHAERYAATLSQIHAQRDANDRRLAVANAARPDRITENQVRYIKALLQKCYGKSHRQAGTDLLTLHGVNEFEQLPRRVASEIIDNLKKLEMEVTSNRLALVELAIARFGDNFSREIARRMPTETPEVLAALVAEWRQPAQTHPAPRSFAAVADMVLLQ